MGHLTTFPGPFATRCAILVVVDFRPVEANLRDSFRVLAAHRPRGEVREYPGISIASAGVTFQMFNAAFLSTPVATENELERRVVQAATHFGARRLDWAWWVCENWLDGQLRRRARHVFRNLHLHLSVELPGMVAEEVLPPEHPLPSLQIRRVRGEKVRDDFCGVGSVCFNVPLDWFREVFDGREVWDDFEAWVGYVEGEPVSTAATVTGSGVVGVYNVATLPGHQRRGYGEALLRYALDRAREEHGITRSILQSTPQGLQLYQRMGYRTVTRVAVYSS